MQFGRAQLLQGHIIPRPAIQPRKPQAGAAKYSFLCVILADEAYDIMAGQRVKSNCKGRTMKGVLEYSQCGD
jgi:hypothetical protein